MTLTLPDEHPLRRIRGARLATLGALGTWLLPATASAAWGEDWGTMVWGDALPAVPALGPLGLGLLSALLVGGGLVWLGMGSRPTVEPPHDDDQGGR